MWSEKRISSRLLVHMMTKSGEEYRHNKSRAGTDEYTSKMDNRKYKAVERADKQILCMFSASIYTASCVEGEARHCDVTHTANSAWLTLRQQVRCFRLGHVHNATIYKSQWYFHRDASYVTRRVAWCTEHAATRVLTDRCRCRSQTRRCRDVTVRHSF